MRKLLLLASVGGIVALSGVSAQVASADDNWYGRCDLFPGVQLGVLGKPIGAVTTCSSGQLTCPIASCSFRIVVDTYQPPTVSVGTGMTARLVNSASVQFGNTAFCSGMGCWNGGGAADITVAGGPGKTFGVQCAWTPSGPLSATTGDESECAVWRTPMKIPD